MRLRTALELLLPVLLIGGLAFAQDVPSQSTPAPSALPAVAPAPAKYYLEIEQADLAAISQALNELPKRIADPLILKLNGQLQAQEQLKAAADKSLADNVEKAKKRK